MNQEPNLPDEHEQLRMYSDPNSQELLEALEQGGIQREKKPMDLSKDGSIADLTKYTKAQENLKHYEAGIPLDVKSEGNHHAVASVNKLLTSPEIEKIISKPELMEPVDMINNLG